MAKWKVREPKSDYMPWDSTGEKLAKINGIEWDLTLFLNPSDKSTHSPYLLRHIDEMGALILRHIEGNGLIAVSFDVDADGITSGTIMYRFLLQHVHPSRLYPLYVERSDGHGIENQIDKIKDGTVLVIVCDSSSGSQSVKAVHDLVDTGISVAIIDHHPAVEEIEILADHGKPCCIMVNPNHPKCNYPNKHLSGAGVVYKVIYVINEYMGREDKEVDQYLDLVAVGMCSDMMDVTDLENRYLIMHGLRHINNPGLQAILKVRKIMLKNVNSQTVGFTIGPMLNGATRMGNIMKAIDLLMQDDPFDCVELAKELNALNDQRKEIEKEVFNRLLPMVVEDDKVVIVWDAEIDKSFNGLVATKFAGAFNRPAIVFQENGNFLSGSYRGVGDINMKEVLLGFKRKVEKSYELDSYGFVEGHEQAGGIGIQRSELNMLIKYLNEVFANEDFEAHIEYDLELEPKEIDDDLMKEVETFQFITGNNLPIPRFKVGPLKVIERSVIGKNKDTVKITCDNGLVLIKFRTDSTFASDLEPRLLTEEDIFGNAETEYAYIDAVGSLNINAFYHGGKKAWVYTNQMFIDDYRIVKRAK